MRKKALSIGSAAASWTLTLLGVPAPVPDVVTGGLSTATAVINALPPRNPKLSSFVANAVKRFNNQCAHEARALSAIDRGAVEEWLIERLNAADRTAMLGAALLGEKEFITAVAPDRTTPTEWDHNHKGYRVALLKRLHSLVLTFAQSPEVLGIASTHALRVLNSELAKRPTLDQVQAMINNAIRQELARRIVAGSRPRLAEGFVTRDELTRVSEALTDGGVATICALQGMRGVGKSQLASAYAEQALNAGWRYVIWITAPSRTQALTEMAEIARSFGISQEDDPKVAARALVSRLNSMQEDRLVVFDNVQQIADLEDLIPNAPGMRVLITTNLATTVGTPVPVGLYSPDQAVAYLIERTGRSDPKGAARVAEDLGYLPVALTQAAMWIGLQEPSFRFDDYRDLLSEHAVDEVVELDGTSYPSRVGAALQLGYTRALESITKTERPEVAEAACAVLDALCLLAETGVLRTWLHKLAPTELTGRKAVSLLLKQSILIASEDGETVELHRLQSQVIREHTPETHQVEAALRVLSAVDLNQPDDYHAQRSLLVSFASQLLAIGKQPHSQTLHEQQDLLALPPLAMLQACELHDPYTAIQLADYLTDSERILGPDHPHTLASRNNLAGAYQAAGDLGRAIPLYQETLTDSERVLGPDHPSTLTSRNNLASAYRATGDLGRAVPLHEQTLTDSERVLGPDHPSTLMSRNNLALAYQVAGELGRAIPLHEQTLTDRERVLGSDHPSTLTSRNNLALAYESAGDLDRAIHLFEEAVTDSERVLGLEHPDTLTFRNNLASTYRATGDLDHAIHLHEQTLTDRERVLGSDHPDTLSSRNNLALAYESASNLDRAIHLFEEAVTDSERVLGPDHPDTLTSRNNLASAHESAGNLDRAIPLFESAAESALRALGPDHPTTHTLVANRDGARREVDENAQDS